MENNLNYRENNHEENESKSTFDYKGVLIRSSVVILGILIILSFNNFYVGSLNPLQNNICYKDQLHDWTSGVNKYFQDTTNYKIDNEMEQAFPIDGCWTNFNTANIKLWGNWNYDRWTDESEVEFAKQIKERYGFNF